MNTSKVLLAVLAVAVFAVGLYVMRNTRVETRNAAIERRSVALRESPLDYVRRFSAAHAAERLRIEQDVAAATATHDAADANAVEIAASFKDGVPGRRRIIVIVTVAAVWAIAVVAVMLLDYPIVLSVSGGNRLYAALGTAVLLVIPTLASLAVSELIERRRIGTLHRSPFSVALLIAVAVVTYIVYLMWTLAPIRSQVEYADAKHDAQNQLAKYKEDNDVAAVTRAQTLLDKVEDEQSASARWNEVLVPLAAGVEFGAGFVLPAAVHLRQLALARRERDNARAAQTRAEDRRATHRANEFNQLSEAFAAAGVSQEALQAAVATMTADNVARQQAAPAPRPGAQPAAGPDRAPAPASASASVGERFAVAEPPPTFAPASAPLSTPASAPLSTPASAPLATPAPDANFDLS